MDDPPLMELLLAVGSVILSVIGGVIALKVDLAKLKNDVEWIKERVSRLEGLHLAPASPKNPSAVRKPE